MKLRQELIDVSNATNQLRREQKAKVHQQMLNDWCNKFVLEMKEEARQGNNEYVFSRASPFEEDVLSFIKDYFEDVTITYTPLTEEDGEEYQYELRFQW